MSDFMKWLYPHYIKPYLDAVPQGDYEMWIGLLDGELPPDLHAVYEKNEEFTAIHAFLLGLRTGNGLSSLTPR